MNYQSRHERFKMPHKNAVKRARITLLLDIHKYRNSPQGRRDELTLRELQSNMKITKYIKRSRDN